MVDIVTRLRGGNRDNVFRFSAVTSDFSLPQNEQSGILAQPSRTRGLREALPREVMLSDREFNHLHLWSYNLTPIYKLGVQDGNFPSHLTFNDPCR